MQVFETKLFAKFARKNRISVATLREAIERAEAGLVDADLGGGIIKQRVARPGAGRSGGFRTLIALRTADFAVLLYGFAKSDRDNIDDEELFYWRALAGAWFGDRQRLAIDVNAGVLLEVEDDEQDEQD